MWTGRIFTLYPELFPGPFSYGLYRKALEKNIWSLKICNIRDGALDKHKTVDDTPFGGGSGMIMKPEVLANSLDKYAKHDEKIIYLSPKGKKLTQEMAKNFLKEKTTNIICGHFEGIDQRVRDNLVTKEISIGDYVLSGGELAAAILCDSIIRLIPVVIGDETSALTDSFQDNLLSSPIYTRPSDYKGWKVPDILISGNNNEIEKWRMEKAIEETEKKRPNLS